MNKEALGASALCRVCRCKPVCDTYKSTGGVLRCEYFIHRIEELKEAFETTQKELGRLRRAMDIKNLSLLIEDIARDPEKTFDLADTPLKRMSPAEINSMPEELGWYENECWFDDEYGCSTYTSKEWGFSLCMSFDGFEWTAHLFGGDMG